MIKYILVQDSEPILHCVCVCVCVCVCLIFVYLAVSDLHCVTWDLLPQRLGLVALWHEDLNSLTSDWTCVPCIPRWILNSWTTREVPTLVLYPNWSLIFTSLGVQNIYATLCHILLLLHCLFMTSVIWFLLPPRYQFCLNQVISGFPGRVAVLMNEYRSDFFMSHLYFGLNLH